MTETRPDQPADAHLTPVRSWVGADISLVGRQDVRESRRATEFGVIGGAGPAEPDPGRKTKRLDARPVTEADPGRKTTQTTALPAAEPDPGRETKRFDACPVAEADLGRETTRTAMVPPTLTCPPPTRPPRIWAAAPSPASKQPEVAIRSLAQHRKARTCGFACREATRTRLSMLCRLYSTIEWRVSVASPYLKSPPVHADPPVVSGNSAGPRQSVTIRLWAVGLPAMSPHSPQIAHWSHA